MCEVEVIALPRARYVMLARYKQSHPETRIRIATRDTLWYKQSNPEMRIRIAQDFHTITHYRHA